MANEALRLPYAWGPGAGGSVGIQHPQDNNSVCGSLLHVDHANQPLWLNGGVVKHKGAGIKETIRFTHFAIDQTFRNQTWYVLFVKL